MVDITNFNPKNLEVFSREVLKMINENRPGWEPMLPTGVAEIIKEHELFGYKPNALVEKSN